MGKRVLMFRAMIVIILILDSVTLNNPDLCFMILLSSKVTSPSQIKEGDEYMSTTQREL